MMTKFHSFYLLIPNPWPLISSLGAFNFLFSFMLFAKFADLNSMGWAFSNLSLIMISWWILYSKEYGLEGKDSTNLEEGLKFAMVLFITSEVWFFFSFFWGYFHFFLSPALESGLSVPSLGVVSFDCSNVPLLNTLVLLSSGGAVTLSHLYLIAGNAKWHKIWLSFTIILGVVFTGMQIMEYSSSFFSISDSTFGTSFFMLTGFHGLHVLVGTLFLLSVHGRISLMTVNFTESTGFELSAWYWHFVDVVWIFLYFSLYYLNT